MQITFKNAPDNVYHQIAKDFLEKYVSSNLLGLGFIGDHYHFNALCTIHLHKNGTHDVHELVGFSNFKNKLNELGINLIKYYSSVFTTQPLAKKSIIISFCGQVDINTRVYNIETVFVIKQNDIFGPFKITNHMLNVFIST